MKNTKRGFTLIELLVVIAIIGILSSVVLASLNTARGKGADAAVKANLANARAQAELFYDNQTPNTYTGVCGATGIASAVDAVSGACGVSADGDQWAATGQLEDDSYFCVDVTGTTATTTNPAADGANFELCSGL
jgi:prepilin-type N-terminal cleavage/methylation domain-containing protein